MSDSTLVNLTRIQETSDGDLEFEVELINMYLDDAEQHLGDIKQAMDSKDAKALRHAAHTLKGASANIGAVGMQQIALEIESAGSEAKLDNLGELWTQLQANMAQTRAFYENYLSTIS